MRKYMDSVVKADPSAQYVDDIGIAAITATYLARKIGAVKKCICQAGLKLAIDKRHFLFAVEHVEFPRKTISSEGVPPQTQKIQNTIP